MSWEYPAQIQVGFLNSYLPLINALNITVTAQYSSGPYTYPNIDITGDYALKYPSASTMSSIYVTGLVLTNVIPQNIYQSITFPGESTPRNCYVFYDSQLATILNNPNNNAMIWYNNYSTSTTNQQSVHYNIFLSAGVPSVPQSITYAGNNYAGTIQLNIILGPPLYADSSNITSSATIKTYKVTYSTLGDLVYRYGGAISQQNLIGTTSTTNTVALSGLYPDCTYGFTGSAQNNTTNTNYGPGIIGTTGTTFLPQPPNNFNISTELTNVWGIGNTAKSTTTNGSTGNIYFSIPSTLTMGITGSIHCVDSRGQTGGTLLIQTLGMTGSFGETGFYPLTFSGFGQNLPGSTSNTLFTFGNTNTTTDYYSTSGITAYYGYYLSVLSSLTFTNSSFIPSGMSNTISLMQTRYDRNGTNINDTNNTYYTFYYDNYTGNPSIPTQPSITLNNTTVFIQVSGIWIAGSTILLNSITTAQNIGTYFYNNSQMLKYTGGSTVTYESNTNYITNGLAGVSNNKYLNSSVTFTRTGTSCILYTSTSYINTINMSLTAYSPLSTGPTATNTSNSLLIICDSPSYNLITSNMSYPLSIQSTQGINKYGFRINSDAPLTIGSSSLVSQIPNTNKLPYDNTVSLLSNYDLQIFNGSYGTFGASGSNGYLNYTGYTGLSDGVPVSAGPVYTGISGFPGMTNVPYRFTTYVWQYLPSATSYANIIINMNGIIGTITNPNGNPYIGTTANQIYFYYRVEDSSTTVYSSGHYNTTWIEINNNSVDTNLTGQNYYLTSLILGGKDSTNSNNFSSGTYTMYGLTPQFIITNTTPIYVYVRIAIPFNSNFIFNNVSVRFLP